MVFCTVGGAILDIVSCPSFIASCIGRGNSCSLSEFCNTYYGTVALMSRFGPLGELGNNGGGVKFLITADISLLEFQYLFLIVLLSVDCS